MSAIAHAEFQRYFLHFKAVLLRTLDAQGRHQSTASGFVRRENGELFLYTCWHVVTGLDKNYLQFRTPPNRTHIELLMQDSEQQNPNVAIIGGTQTVTLPLYDEVTGSPLWLQDRRHIPNADLNAIGVFVPFWHDAVKLKLPENLRVLDVQLVGEESTLPQNTTITVGDKLYIVGFPYGFSVFGSAQPTPVVLTRHVAATSLGDRLQELLLDGSGEPSMSGGPVFIEKVPGIHLLGMYTGQIYPDHILEQNSKATALGTCSSLSSVLGGHLPFTSRPDETVFDQGTNSASGLPNDQDR